MKVYDLEWSHAGQKHRRRIPFGERLVIGHYVDCNIIVTGPFVSRYHAEIGLSNGILTLRNLSGTNPVILEDESTMGRGASAKLSAGDVFQIGDFCMTPQEVQFS